MVIYEVNLSIEPDILSDYLTWLRPHIDEILALPGFIAATLFAVESQEAQAQYCVQYQVDSRESLEDYFTEHAARLRGDGVKRFDGKFSATRRIMVQQ